MFGNLTFTPTPGFGPGVHIFTAGANPVETLQGEQLEALYTLIGDVLGKARVHIGPDDTDVLERWQGFREAGETDYDLSRSEAVLLFGRATRHYETNDHYVRHLITETLEEFLEENRLRAGSHALARSAQDAA